MKKKSSHLPATFYSTAKNIFSTAIKYLTTLLTTYPIYTSNLPILPCWHQLRSLWATLQYQCDHFLQPHAVKCASKYRKEKQWKSIVIYKPYFLFFNDHSKDIWLNLLLRRLHSDPKFKWNLNSYSQTLTLLFITYTIYP